MSFTESAPDAALLPPRARRQPSPTNIHGHILEDDYAWLRNQASPEVIAYLEAENAYTEAVMEPTRPLQEQLYREMLSHIKETDESVPYPNHGWLYWTRTIEGSQYPIHCRRANLSGSPEEILLDVNQLAQAQPACSPTPPTTPASASTPCTCATF
jgi:oligopeptidase B